MRAPCSSLLETPWPGWLPPPALINWICLQVSASSGEGRVLQADTAWGRSGGVSSQQQAQESGALGGAAPDASTATSQKAAVKEFASDAQVGHLWVHPLIRFWTHCKTDGPADGSSTWPQEAVANWGGPGGSRVQGSMLPSLALPSAVR